MGISDKTFAWRPRIYNVTMTLADTEYSQELPIDTLKVLVHTRDESTFRIAWEAGRVATPTVPYFTVLSNSRYFEDDINLRATAHRTIYFASDDAGKVVEIIAWATRA
jgi:hypothetical protein